VTPSGSGAALGIDLESVERVKDVDITSVVCRDAERNWVLAGGSPHERLCMIFSAKEAVYKSLFPHYQRYIDFLEVELTWLPEQSCFRAEFFPEQGFLPKAPIFVQCGSCSNLVFCCSLHSLHND
jgi:4'-phosphopantetheinyl transferase EntD